MKRKQSTGALIGIVTVLLLAISYLLGKYGIFEWQSGNYYGLTIEMPDATGLKIKAPVRIGGVPIGRVSGPPRLKGDSSVLEVPLEIYEGANIPDNSLVTIATTGLIGESYVKFSLASSPSDQFIIPGTSLKVVPTRGLKSLQNDADGVINQVNDSFEELSGVIENLDRIFTKVEKLIDSNDSADLGTTLSDFGVVAKNAKEASVKLNPLLGTAEEAVTSIRDTAVVLKASSGKFDPLLVSAEETISELKVAVTEVRKVVGSAEETLETGNGVIRGIGGVVNKVEPGFDEIGEVLAMLRRTLEQFDQLANATDESDGLIKTLWDDPEFKKDVKDLIHKIERNGVIFYPKEKDREKSPLIKSPVRRRY